MPRSRCPKGTRKNRATGKCEKHKEGETKNVVPKEHVVHSLAEIASLIETSF